jgi:lysophospholipase L1-like esterase
MAGIADRNTYLKNICDEMDKKWPDNRTVNIVCHGHSVPSGYFATPFVDTFNAYPHLLHRKIKERFPYAVVNVIVSAIGGEDSQKGSIRFSSDVTRHIPDVVTIDYALNDRGIGPEASREAHRRMIYSALTYGSKVILMTPSWEQSYFNDAERWAQVAEYREKIIALAAEYGVGLADSYAAFEKYVVSDGDLNDLLSHVNHPNRKGHELIATELARWFPAR